MDRYAELRAALPELMEEARRQGGTNPRAQMIIALLAERDAMKEALEMIAGIRPCADALMGNADIARAALAQEQGGKE